jgi:FAD:protein FMN transferase
MSAAITRARPWLGTLVQMQVEGLPETDALRAIDAAFAEVAQVHRLMSFHEADSDIGRLHAAPPGAAVAVDARTWEVLEIAGDVAAASQGIFDITIAPRLVAGGRLPRPVSPFAPDPQATWRDIERLDGMCVRLRRPLWLDLGGIAKGFAVDRAIAVLQQAGAKQAVVNAGGDLRCFGARPEAVYLRLDQAGVHVPLLELSNAAVATSARDPGLGAGQPGAHVHGVTREAIGNADSVCVVAAHCVIADAVTKVVLAGDAIIAQQVLARFAAEAGMLDPVRGWRALDRAA